MNYRVLERRVYWRWLAELELEDGPTLRLSGDVARWIRPGERVDLRGAAAGDTLEGRDFTLERDGRVLWPPFARELEHERQGAGGRVLYSQRLRVREASREEDYEAVAALEALHALPSPEAALWACPDGSRLRAGDKPRCGRGYGRFLEVRGSSPASRFLLLEAVQRAPGDPPLLAYLRLDPPLPASWRRGRQGVVRNAREAAFPADWFKPGYDPKALTPNGRSCAETVAATLDELRPAAARVGRVLVHPDFRSDGLGPLLLRLALQWLSERAVPDGRREKELVCAMARAARYHPFLEKAGFRYLWESVSSTPFLAHPLSDAAAARLRRFLNNDLEAREHGGRLYEPRYPKVQGLAGPLALWGVSKSLKVEDEPYKALRRVLRACDAAGPLRRPLLQGVNLRLPAAGVTVLWGENEAGKAALLRLLWDELPDEGWVDAPAGRVAAWLPGAAEPPLEPRPLLEQVAARLASSSAAAELLGRLGLADALRWRAEPEQLCAAGRARARLALLLANTPDLLLLDGFTDGLNPPAARRLARALATLTRAAGITLLVSCRRPEVREALEADRVVVVGYEAVKTVPGP